MVPSSENPYPIIDAIHKLVEKDTQANAQAAEHEWQSAIGSYRTVQAVSAAPAINLRPTTAGVEVHVRYITRAGSCWAQIDSRRRRDGLDRKSTRLNSSHGSIS